MAEEEESCTSAEKIKLSSIIRAIVGIVLIFGIIIFQVMLMKAINLNNWSSRSVLMVMIDFPSLLTSVIYVLPLIAISGNFKELCAACKTVFSNKKISVTKKNLYLNAVKTTVQGFRIINKNPEFLAPSHGCVIQNRAIMHYTLFVV